MGEKRNFSFAKRAAHYDGGLEGRLSKRFYRLILDSLRPGPEERILDVGCGTGALLRLLSGRQAFQGFGIDAEPNMVREAAAKCPQMTILLSPCHRTPFSDGQFDRLIVCMAYHHFPDQEAFMAEAARILRPGGRLYLADPNFPQPVRRALNGLFSALRVAGAFFSGEELAERFRPFGFSPAEHKTDAYAQLAILQKTGGAEEGT